MDVTFCDGSEGIASALPSIFVVDGDFTESSSHIDSFAYFEYVLVGWCVFVPFEPAHSPVDYVLSDGETFI